MREKRIAAEMVDHAQKDMPIKEGENINSLAERIINANASERKILCNWLDEDWDIFDTLSGTLTEGNAFKLIKRSRYQSEITLILPHMLKFSDSHTISERVFSSLCRYPNKRCRNSLLISIAHCPISFYQLQEICRRKICVEAFAALLDMYAANDIFTVDDLKKLVADNKWCVRSVNYHAVLEDGIISGEKKAFVEMLEKRYRRMRCTEIWRK